MEGNSSCDLRRNEDEIAIWPRKRPLLLLPVISGSRRESIHPRWSATDDTGDSIPSLSVSP